MRVAANAFQDTGVGGHKGIPHNKRAASIVRNLAAFVRCVEAASTSASKVARAAAHSASDRTFGIPTNWRANLPGASARRPGSGWRGGERERGPTAIPSRGFTAAAVSPTETRRDDDCALDLLAPAAALAVAFAFETRSTGAPEAQPTIGEGAVTEARNAVQG